jgi:hypothetical protein
VKVRVWSIVVLLFIAFVVSFVKADTFSPSHSCRKPFKPYSFTSKWELENFNDDVRRFRSCIEAFVEEQEDAIKKHRSAANDAIDEWNRFLKYELR